MFQHTAARRRLVLSVEVAAREVLVSTHSRPKAAGRLGCVYPARLVVSTHSRPKAAGVGVDVVRRLTYAFQHTAARRRLAVFPLQSR